MNDPSAGARPPEAPPISDSARSAGSEFAHSLQLRLELAKLEATEAFGHFLKLAIVGIVAALLVALAYLFACAGLVIILADWLEKPWEWVALGFAGVHLFIALILFFVLKSKLANPIFPATVNQLKKDRQWLGKDHNTP
ncbi:hypothetical protein BH23VER1_BH23VER1_18870 [soil metagenome]